MGVLTLLSSRRSKVRTENPSHLLKTKGPESVQVFGAQELLAPHQRLVSHIRQQTGVPPAHWAALYERLLHNFAGFVQQLPASEAHHHREAGGLLQHGLDTALRALTIRRGVLLPPGATAEQLTEKQDVWNYATATAALLHDLGKPVVDQVVTLYDNDGRDIGHWNPLAGPIETAAAYSVSFVRGRRYRLHPRIPPLLVQFIVPPIGLAWITSDLSVFEAWLATISGGDSEFAGELGQIIKQADGLSVATDLTACGAPVAVGACPAPRSMGERLAVALRHLVDSQSLPLNRPGAAGWVIGDDLWLVSKRVLDALRDQLAQDSGGAAVPRNERLMDELQQNGIVMSNGDRAIWAALIELGDWRQRFTLLRVPLARLWLDPGARPPAISGRAIPESAENSAAEPGQTDVRARQEPAAETSALGVSLTAAEASYADLPLPPLAVSTSVSHETEPQPPSTIANNQPHRADDIGEAQPSPHSKSRKARTAQRAASPTTSDGTLDNDFLRWIRDGVAEGRLKVNTVDARLHVTQEGLLLVSPGIFRDFAGVDGWTATQKKLQRLQLHLKTPEGTNIWTYRVSGKRKPSAQLKGLVLPNGASVLGLKLPQPNRHLSLIQSEPTVGDAAGLGS